MNEIFVRFAIVVMVSVFMIIVVWLGRRFVETRRQRALAAPLSPSIDAIASRNTTIEKEVEKQQARVRILAFSSDDCRQCHQLQAPVLRRVIEARGDAVTVIDIDAPASPELTERYQVLTLPTTVMLDSKGKTHAVNYGFTNAYSLLKQVDEILALDEYAKIV